MRFSLAIVALLGASNAIKIQAEPAAAAAPADAAVEKAAEKAAEPEKPKTKVAAVVKEALETSDEKVQGEVAKAGQKIDVSGAPEAIT